MPQGLDKNPTIEKTMKISAYKPNQTIVHTPGWTALLSYSVPQVVVFHDNHARGGTVLVNNRRYSNTTSKHRKAFVRTLDENQYTILDATPQEIQAITGLETQQ
jgi:hypothetical protein